MVCFQQLASHPLFSITVAAGCLRRSTETTLGIFYSYVGRRAWYGAFSLQLVQARMNRCTCRHKRKKCPTMTNHRPANKVISQSWLALLSYPQGRANGYGRYGIAVPLHIRIFKRNEAFLLLGKPYGKSPHYFVTLITVCDIRSSYHSQVEWYRL